MSFKKESEKRFERLKSEEVRKSLKEFYFLEKFSIEKRIGNENKSIVETIDSELKNYASLVFDRWEPKPKIDFRDAFRNVDMEGYKFRLTIVLAEDLEAAIQYDWVLKSCKLYYYDESFDYTAFTEIPDYEKKYHVECRCAEIVREINTITQGTNDRIRDLNKELVELRKSGW